MILEETLRDTNWKMNKLASVSYMLAGGSYSDATYELNFLEKKNKNDCFLNTPDGVEVTVSETGCFLKQCWFCS